MRRKSNWSFVLGTLCCAGLAAAVAGAAVVLIMPSRASDASSIDIARTEAPAAPNWNLQPLKAEAQHLFLVTEKGPRADRFSGETADQPKILLASMPQTDPPAGQLPQQTPQDRLWPHGRVTPEAKARDITCLTEVIYHEARAEPAGAQIAVGQTVINRVLSGAYPRTLCGVVSQRSVREGDCQYSFVCDGLSSLPKVKADWELAGHIAERLLNGSAWMTDLGDATHFHPLAEQPAWQKYLQRVKRVGGLVFYRGDFSASAKPAAIAVN